MYLKLIVTVQIVVRILILLNGVYCNEDEVTDDVDDYDTDRIVGGKYANISQVPYQVQYGGCGGAILTPIWVITAGHCGYASYWIRAGSSTGSEGQVVKVVERIPHPEFGFHDIVLNNETILDEYGSPQEYQHHDLMLMKLELKLNFNNNVKGVEIGDNSQIKPGTIGLISGWGQTSFTGSTSSRLKVAEIPVYDQEKCRDFHKQFGVPVDESMFCALSKNETDACLGDSGGPFVINNKLVGITSFGRGCAFEDSPSIWASVPYAKDWINSVIYRDVYRKRFRGFSG